MTSAENPRRLPISRSAFDRLGDRLLASGAGAGAADLDLLADVLSAYDDALAEAKEAVTATVASSRLAADRFSVTTRIKTTGTIIDKLQREQGMGLKGMQDIAGLRVVAEMSRGEQDSLAALLAKAFAAGRREPRVVDRRDNPSCGYRAVHLIVHVDDIPVELQLRTANQHYWAELFEKLADLWGRGIRYGLPPEDPTSTLLAGQVTRASVVDLMMQVSDHIAELEAWHDREALLDRELLDLDAQLPHPEQATDNPHLADLRGRVAEIKASAEERRTKLQLEHDGLRRLLVTLHDVVEDH